MTGRSWVRVMKSASCKCKVRLPTTIDPYSESDPSLDPMYSRSFIALDCPLFYWGVGGGGGEGICFRIWCSRLRHDLSPIPFPLFCILIRSNEVLPLFILKACGSVIALPSLLLRQKFLQREVKGVK